MEDGRKGKKAKIQICGAWQVLSFLGLSLEANYLIKSEFK